MEKWLHDRLSHCLDFEVPDDMIKYILTLKDSNEFDAYFETLLDKECEDQKLFLSDCRQRLFGKSLPSKSMPLQHQQPLKKSQQNVTKNKKADGNGEANDAGQQHQGKKKTKFVNLYATDGKIVSDTILLKGRRPCLCEATEHQLINNCLKCGRIVCEQEGSGPCLFCGEIVCTNDELQVLSASNKKSQQLLKSLKEKTGGGEGLKKALEHRDRLLEYERNSEKRTTVIDDELDYFQENSVWLSDAEREKFERLKREMHEKKHASRAKRSIKIDFAGRAIDDDNQISEEYERQVLSEVASAVENDSSHWSNRQASNSKNFDDSIDPNLEGARPVFRITKEGKQFAKSVSKLDGLERSYNRVQDKELLEMQDMRHCLSLHQPWASLLVAGIKKHEGRVWYSDHRGRLWIASTAKEPRSEDIEYLENFYKNHYNDSDLKFPDTYPTGCLLGCVKVDDCMPQEEYREVYPNGESDSPYVFVCSNPEQLPVVFPIKGEHKIYSIDQKIHNAACKTLLRKRSSKAAA